MGAEEGTAGTAALALRPNDGEMRFRARGTPFLAWGLVAALLSSALDMSL